MTEVLHRLGVNVTQFANGVMRPSPYCKVVRRADLAVSHKPSKKLALWLGMSPPNLLCVEGGKSAKELAPVRRCCCVASRCCPLPSDCVRLRKELHLPHDTPKLNEALKVIGGGDVLQGSDPVPTFHLLPNRSILPRGERKQIWEPEVERSSVSPSIMPKGAFGAIPKGDLRRSTKQRHIRLRARDLTPKPWSSVVRPCKPSPAKDVEPCQTFPNRTHPSHQGEAVCTLFPN